MNEKTAGVIMGAIRSQVVPSTEDVDLLERIVVKDLEERLEGATTVELLQRRIKEVGSLLESLSKCFILLRTYEEAKDD